MWITLHVKVNDNYCKSVADEATVTQEPSCSAEDSVHLDLKNPIEDFDFPILK